MKTIKYRMADGTVVDVEVSEEVAQSLKEMQREEWRQDKQVKRNEMPISLTQMEDENGYQLVDYASDPLDQMIEKENRAERRAKIIEELKSLTPEQLDLVKMLYQGMTLTEIADKRGVSKQSVSEAKERLKKRFEKFLP